MTLPKSRQPKTGGLTPEAIGAANALLREAVGTGRVYEVNYYKGGARVMLPKPDDPGHMAVLDVAGGSVVAGPDRPAGIAGAADQFPFFKASHVETFRYLRMSASR